MWRILLNVALPGAFAKNFIQLCACYQGVSTYNVVHVVSGLDLPVVIGNDLHDSIVFFPFFIHLSLFETSDRGFCSVQLRPQSRYNLRLVN
jgi:hypothetical protein